MKIKYISPNIWNDEILSISENLSDSHRSFLSEKGWTESYQPNLPGIIGGEISTHARDHVINRFLNSAARMQYVCTDPNKEQPHIRQMILDQLALGEIFILDVAAGNGAGTLSILSSICELREHNIIPTLPLNVSIFGLDISPDALNFYAAILGKITPRLKSCGIQVAIDLCVCNLKISGEIDQVLDTFFDAAKGKNCKRFLCTISALSGVKKEGMAEMMDSLKLIAARLSHKTRSSSWLWVEPKVEKTWLSVFASAVRLTFKQLIGVLNIAAEKSNSSGISGKAETARTFKWIDPLNGHLTTSHVIVVEFRNS